MLSILLLWLNTWVLTWPKETSSCCRRSPSSVVCCRSVQLAKTSPTLQHLFIKLLLNLDHFLCVVHFTDARVVVQEGVGIRMGVKKNRPLLLEEVLVCANLQWLRNLWCKQQNRLVGYFLCTCASSRLSDQTSLASRTSNSSISTVCCQIWSSASDFLGQTPFGSWKGTSPNNASFCKAVKCWSRTTLLFAFNQRRNNKWCFVSSTEVEMFSPMFIYSEGQPDILELLFSPILTLKLYSHYSR